MTVSMFDAYMERMPATRATRMMDLAQTGVYAQAMPEDRRRIWNGWSNTISRITHAMTVRDNATDKSIITWNGEAVNWKFIKQKFTSMFGRRAVE
jgi:hypothetical protein